MVVGAQYGGLGHDRQRCLYDEYLAHKRGNPVSLKALGVVVIHVFSGICGVYIIFKLQDIISSMIGINGDDSNISQITEKLQQKMAGDMVKV